MKIILTLGIVLVGIAFPVTTHAQDVCTPCSPRDEHLESQTIRYNLFHFTWISEWHQLDPKRKCFYREVSNKGDRPLYYSWPLAGVPLNIALSPGSSDKICTYGGDNRNPSTPGFLYYGRRGYKTETHVWQTTNEKNEESGLHKGRKNGSDLQTYESARLLPTSFSQAAENSTDVVIEYPPLLTTVKLHLTLRDRVRRYVMFIPLPKKTRKYSVEMTVSSTVKRIQDEYEITNKVVSLNQQELPSAGWYGLFYPHSAGAAAVGPSFLHGIPRKLLNLIRPRSAVEFPRSKAGSNDTIEDTTPFLTRRPILKSNVVWINTRSGEGVVVVHIPFWSPY